MPFGQWQTEMQCALDLAFAAGAQAVAAATQGLHVEYKPGDEPVTAADRAASQSIVAGLQAQFPDDVIVSEESADMPTRTTRSRVWFIDPIDGTKDFIAGRPAWAVMIGLAVDGAPCCGVVHAPALGRTYAGAASVGARFWQYAAAPPQAAFSWTAASHPLQVSTQDRASEARLVASFNHRGSDIDDVKRALGIANEHNIGSIGVKLCLIAEGERDLYVNPSPKAKLWDTCAPHAILAAAGGRLTDLRGDAIDYQQAALAHHAGLVASNGHLHREVTAKLRGLFARHGTE